MTIEWKPKSKWSDANSDMFSQENRENLFQSLKILYLTLVKQNLPIFGIAKAKQLADFSTSQQDISRGISRMPLILARLYEEDISFQANMPTSYRISPMSKVKKVELPESTTIENLA
jgi:hypothetical protein